MSASAPTALVADDEPLLREALVEALAAAWPDLRVVAQARNGREALQGFDQHHPDICFLDVQMPGLSGIEVAQRIGDRAHLVFVTAYDHYAVQAFAEGVLDYLVKPVEPGRLAATVARIRKRLEAAVPAQAQAAALERVAEQLSRLEVREEPCRLRWLRAQTGTILHLIPVEQVDYLRSDSKYTRIAWHDDRGAAQESYIRTSLRELLAQLDPEGFAQVHRSIVVNLRAIQHVVRGESTGRIHLRGRLEVLEIGRSFLNRFRQM